MCPSGSHLSNVRLFATLTPEEREALAGRGRVVQVPAGTLLIREGDEADSLFALLSGSMTVLQREAGGRDVAIATLSPGECFGELALLDGGQRSASIMAAESCTCFRLHYDVFWEFAAGAPVLLRKLLGELSRRIRDTSIRLAHAELESRMQAAKAEVQRHRAITNTVTGLAHEMNTPLGVCVTLTSFVEGWLEGAPPPVATALREPMAMIHENLRGAVALMQGFDALAAGHHAEPLETIDLRALIEEIGGLFALERPEHRLSVVVEGGASPWHGRAAPLQRVVMELLSNAAAHAYAGEGGPVRIRLEADTVRDRPVYRVSVRDHGAGIAPDHQPKLIDPFFTTARGRGHKGLGLAVAYNAVTGPLAGTFAVESAPGAGTTVTLLIPQRLPPGSALG